MALTPEEWQRELAKNQPKKDSGNKRDNQKEPRRDDNQRDDHHDSGDDGR